MRKTTLAMLFAATLPTRPWPCHKAALRVSAQAQAKAAQALVVASRLPSST